MSYISTLDQVNLIDEIELTDAQLEAVYGGHGGCDDNQCDDDDNQCDDDDNRCHDNNHKCKRHHHHHQCHFQNHCCW